jgi:hypothetical protein
MKVMPFEPSRALSVDPSQGRDIKREENPAKKERHVKTQIEGKYKILSCADQPNNTTTTRRCQKFILLDHISHFAFRVSL